MTFLSLFFSAISSFPALAACRDSCLEVNFEVVNGVSLLFIRDQERAQERVSRAFTLRLKSDFSRPPDMLRERLLS